MESTLSWLLVIIIHIALLLLSRKIYRGNINGNIATIQSGLSRRCPYWNVLVMIRWTATISIMVCLRNFPCQQIQVLTILSFAWVSAILYLKPFD